MAGFWETVPGNPDTVIAIPHAAVTPLTMDWVGNLVHMDKPGADSKLLSWKGLPVDVVRNRMAMDALALKARYIFFLDSDIMPPPEAINRLKSWRLPIVSGLYWSKRGHIAAWRRSPDLPDKYVPVRPEEMLNETLPEVDVIPMGCALIDTRVFSVIPQPWFDWTVADPLKGEGLTEDFYFSRKAQEYGFRIYIDKAVRCLHEGVIPIDVEGKSALHSEQAAQLVKLGGG